MIDPGRRNRRVWIEKRDPNACDEFGKKVGWVRVGLAWAQVLEATARERTVAQGSLAVRAATFTIPFRSDLTPAMRLVRDDGTAWQITGIAELGFREETQITAEAQDTPTRG